MFEAVSEKLQSVFRNVRGYGKITESNVAETLREVRRVLLDADVNYKVAKQFVEDVQVRAIGQEVLTSITPGQHIVKIIYEEMVKLMGSSRADISYASFPPTVVLLVGLQGSGKTTLAAKLGLHLRSKGRHPLLVAADIHRPAAADQLEILGRQIEIPVCAERSDSAVQVAEASLDVARKQSRDVVILDTAGRHHIDEQMMLEVEQIKASVQPNEILFVVDSMTGQDAVNTAKAFHERLVFDGIVLTKLDGDTRGGAAMSIRAVTNKPIKFVSAGETLDALEPFYPERMASRILGMGDIVTLVEKAQQQVDEHKAARLEERFRKAQFTFEDFLDQLQQIKNMGSLSSLIGMIPGMQRMAGGAEIDDGGLKRIEAIIQSMTREERRKPNLINGSRRRRIAAGSGTTVQEVNRLLKQFAEMQKMMKNLSKGKSKHILHGMQLRT